MDRGPWTEEISENRLNLSAQVATLSRDVAEREERIARLALTNRMLRDRVKDLIDKLADFGVYEPQ